MKAIVAQKLLKTTDDWQAKGVGRVPINEIMIVKRERAKSNLRRS